MKDALIEGARRWDYMMVGNEKEGSGVVPATLFFVFLVGRWWMVGSALPSGYRFVWLGLKLGGLPILKHPNAYSSSVGNKSTITPPSKHFCFSFKLYRRNSLCGFAQDKKKTFMPHIGPSPYYLPPSLHPSSYGFDAVFTARFLGVED